MCFPKKWLISIIVCLSLLSNFIPFSQASACTCVLHIDPLAVMVGRNMDWFEEMQTQLRIYPRGIQRSGKATEGSSINWISKYGSMAVISKGVTTEGINERGFSVHMLSLPESDYGIRQLNMAGMSVSMWAQYYLDQFATIAEVLKAGSSPNYQLERFFLPHFNQPINVHLALEDAQGHSAVIEYIEGKLTIYTSDKNSVLTNSPTYNVQLKHLQTFSGFGGDKPLPGTTLSEDRFIRASYYNQHLSTAKLISDEVFSIFSILRNTAQPYGMASAERPFVSYTIWQTVGDLTHRVYYYSSTSSINMIKISLDKFDLTNGKPTLMLDIDHHPELAGDVSDQFTPFYAE